LLFDDMREIQQRFGYLPPDQMQLLSARRDIPLYQINGVAEFYPEFRLQPPAQTVIEVCTDLTCHLKGAEALLQTLAKTGVEIRRRSCPGQCDSAPAISGMVPPVLPTACARFKSDPYTNKPKYGALRNLLESQNSEAVLTTLKASNLGGMGGAGFPVATKWQAVRQSSSFEKYIVCNADESEPGSIKDRVIMTHLPHLVIEGIIIGALVTGAKQGYLYLRHEYKDQELILRAEIEACQRDGLLGENFHLEMFISPGGYICGEATAQLEAIEGKRAEPRNRPPNATIAGLWGKPTVVNNVETFANIPQILSRGLDWFHAQGRNGASGLKFVGVTGDVLRPGVFEIPMGTPIREVVENHAGGALAGRTIKAFSPSGAASGFLPWAPFHDTPLDFASMRAAGTMLGSGAIVVLDDTRCILDLTLNATTFFRNESCGKCMPCRVGSQKLVDILDGWTHGRGTKADIALVNDLAETLEQTSICGLGQFVPTPVSTALRWFRQEMEDHVYGGKCPAGVCPMKAR
jgi:NADH:ubiquinone oxidoreductase subunit F (NADH-binding)